MKLWDGMPPHQSADTELAPELHIRAVEGAELGIVICPGGAYMELAEHEGAAYAAWLNSVGVSAAVLDYRVAPCRAPAQMADVQRAIRLARHVLAQHGVRKLGVMGSSAGGHLAALLCYATWLQEAFRFPAERIAACISIAGVADAADLLVKPFPTYAAWRTQVDLRTDGRSRADMLKAVARYSPVHLVEEEAANGTLPHVPLFVVHGRDDTLSPYGSQVRLVEALRKANGAESAELLTLEGRRWQHMNTTVTMHKDAVEESAALSALFAWLERT